MLTMQGICAAYGRRTILRDVSLTLVPHTLTAVVGKNGCGKSTLIACVNQMLPYTGEIAWAGRNLALLSPAERARLVAILPQVLSRPHVTVEQLVAFGRSPYVDIGRRLTAVDRAAIADAMMQMGVDNLAQAYVDELSGGERQKAYLAMILAQGTRVVILDEPTTHMDMTYEGAFFQQLDDLKAKHKKTLLVVMHDLNRAIRHAQRLVVLEDGAVRFQGETAACLESGVLEDVFALRRYTATDQGQERIFFSSQ